MRRLKAALALAAFAVAGRARAQEAEDLASVLNESVVTTASQTAQTESAAPATSTTLRADDLRRYGIHTLEEAVNFLSLGVSSAGGRSAYSEIDLGARGVFLTGDIGKHFLLLIDGHAVNEPFIGVARFDQMAGIPLELVDHIEVIVGPGSVLYGSNAMLGVIHVITKSAATLSGGHVAAETEIPGWRRAAALAGASFRLFGEKTELTSAFQYWNDYGPNLELGPQQLSIDPITQKPQRAYRGDPDVGIWGGTAEHSSYSHIPSGAVKVRWGNFELSVHGRIAKRGQPFATGDFDDPEAYFRERSLWADLKHEALLSSRFHLTTRLYGDAYDSQNRQDFSRPAACPYTGVTTCQYRYLTESRWAGAEIQGSYDWLSDGSLNTLIGVDGRTRRVRSKVDTLDFDTERYLANSVGVVDRSSQIIGAYIQQIWSPSAHFGFNAGARLDHDPRFDAVLSPRAAANVGLWPGGTFRAIYSEAFRAPSFQETDFSNLTLAKALPLEPERVRSLEASVEHRVGAQKLLFGVFRSWWKNLVELRFLSYDEAVRAAEQGRLPLAIPTISYTQYDNASSIDSYGANVSFEGSLVEDRLRYALHLTEAFSRRNDPVLGSQPLSVAPRFYGNARLSYDFGGALPTAALGAYTLSVRRADRSVESGFVPAPTAPTQVDLRATLSGPIAVLKGLSYRISADVLVGDRGPYVIGPTLVATPDTPTAELDPLPGFRATIGLSYDFFTQ